MVFENRGSMVQNAVSGVSGMRRSSPIAFVLFVSAILAAHDIGRITGVVFNEDGQLAEHVHVCTSLKSGNRTTINCLIPVDTSGTFQIENLKLGTYNLFAVDESNGYSIDNQSPGQQVKVTADNSSLNVTIRMQPRGAVLSGIVTDKISGKPLGTAWVHWISLDDAYGGGSAGTLKGRIQIAVPVNSDLIILVTAKGYKGWVYTDALNSTRPVLRLASGERKTLDVELEPFPKTVAVPADTQKSP
jgi:hypothetical protein